MHYVSNFLFGAQGNRTGSCGQLSDNDEIAATFRFGEVAAQLQLTYGEVRALDVEAMAGIWKVTYSSCLKYHLLKKYHPAARLPCFMLPYPSTFEQSCRSILSHGLFTCAMSSR